VAVLFTAGIAVAVRDVTTIEAREAVMVAVAVIVGVADGVVKPGRKLVFAGTGEGVVVGVAVRVGVLVMAKADATTLSG
jgi:hypothetical protein